MRDKIRHKKLSVKKQAEVVEKEHKSYYMKVRGIINYLMKKELNRMMQKPIKRGSSLIIVAKASR